MYPNRRRDSASRPATGSEGRVTLISTNQDADTDDETFTVALGSLPPEVTAGSPRSVTVTIRDDDGGTTPTTPAVSLSASPNPVDEGEAVMVTARLSSALGSAVTIPLSLSNGTAEDGDYGSLASITINSGATSGTGRISTNEDTDTDDETFTAALGNLPSSVAAGSPSSVEVTITDDDSNPTVTTPAVTLSASPETEEEGGAVTVTATASETVRANTEVKLVRDGASTASDEDFSFDAPQMGVITTWTARPTGPSR